MIKEEESLTWIRISVHHLLVLENSTATIYHYSRNEDKKLAELTPLWSEKLPAGCKHTNSYKSTSYRSSNGGSTGLSSHEVWCSETGDAQEERIIIFVHSRDASILGCVVSSSSSSEELSTSSITETALRLIPSIDSNSTLRGEAWEERRVQGKEERYRRREREVRVKNDDGYVVSASDRGGKEVEWEVECNYMEEVWSVGAEWKEGKVDILIMGRHKKKDGVVVIRAVEREGGIEEEASHKKVKEGLKGKKVGEVTWEGGMVDMVVWGKVKRLLSVETQYPYGVHEYELEVKEREERKEGEKKIESEEKEEIVEVEKSQGVIEQEESKEDQKSERTEENERWDGSDSRRRGAEEPRRRGDGRQDYGMRRGEEYRERDRREGHTRRGDGRQYYMRTEDVGEDYRRKGGEDNRRREDYYNGNRGGDDSRRRGGIGEYRRRDGEDSRRGGGRDGYSYRKRVGGEERRRDEYRVKGKGDSEYENGGDRSNWRGSGQEEYTVRPQANRGGRDSYMRDDKGGWNGKREDIGAQRDRSKSAVRGFKEEESSTLRHKPAEGRLRDISVKLYGREKVAEVDRKYGFDPSRDTAVIFSSMSGPGGEGGSESVEDRPQFTEKREPSHLRRGMDRRDTGRSRTPMLEVFKPYNGPTKTIEKESKRSDEGEEERRREKSRVVRGKSQVRTVEAEVEGWDDLERTHRKSGRKRDPGVDVFGETETNNAWENNTKVTKFMEEMVSKNSEEEPVVFEQKYPKKDSRRQGEPETQGSRRVMKREVRVEKDGRGGAEKFGVDDPKYQVFDIDWDDNDKGRRGGGRNYQSDRKKDHESGDRRSDYGGRGNGNRDKSNNRRRENQDEESDWKGEKSGGSRSTNSRVEKDEGRRQPEVDFGSNNNYWTKDEPRNEELDKTGQFIVDEIGRKGFDLIEEEEGEVEKGKEGGKVTKTEYKPMVDDLTFGERPAGEIRETDGPKVKWDEDDRSPSPIKNKNGAGFGKFKK